MNALYVVATPIGNLADMTFRAVETLKTVDLIFAEDTRHSKKLLMYYGISTRLSSFHEHNEKQRLESALEKLREGRSIALISDAGTPTISDPGYRLVKACRENGITVIPIPGANAAVCALSASGLATDRFLFIGFLPEKRSKQTQLLSEISEVSATLVFYMSPHKAVRQISTMAEVLGDRPCVLARELTKIHEEFTSVSLIELQKIVEKEGVKGEMTLLVSPAEPKPESEVELEIDEYVRLRKSEGIKGKTLVLDLMNRFGLKKSDAYRRTLDEENS